MWMFDQLKEAWMTLNDIYESTDDTFTHFFRGITVNALLEGGAGIRRGSPEPLKRVITV